ncbi:integration host factor subunit alpha [Mycoavidus sp. HKI]|nr:integration host factor subunit alpha [Mycoavidus sp. HKI]
MNPTVLSAQVLEQHAALESANPPQDLSQNSSTSEVPTLTKAELAEFLFDQVGLNKREAKEMVDAFFELIGDALERGESVKLSGFGNFQLRDKSQRPGRNLRTGETIPIAARRVVTFHASQKLKELVEGNMPAVQASAYAPL